MSELNEANPKSLRTREGKMQKIQMFMKQMRLKYRGRERT